MSDSNSDIDEWRLYASCLGLEWEIFFPNRGESIRRPKSICDKCIVQVECLDDALNRKEPAGVRGGFSTRERRKVLSAKRKRLA